MNGATNERARELLPAKVGFFVLAATAVFVFSWLALQSHADTDARSDLPPLLGSEDLARFKADAFYLPAEPMLGFVAVPGGPFLMGSDPEIDSQAFENERWSTVSVQGTVDLPTFYIGRYEVTVAQFRAFVEATGYKVDSTALRAPATLPVADVTWADAIAYAHWLQSALREAPATPQELRQLLEEGWRITLPTEAQWEKAARGANGRIYPWGSGTEIAANYRSNARIKVGSFPCSQCMHGLADMSGNVWELTRSPYEPYPYTETDDRDTTGAALFVMRGGGYADQNNMLRAAVRGGIDPGVRRNFIGFRVVLTRD